MEDATRVLFNSTFGIGGLFDFASDLGLPKRNEDFGQTLGVWGVGTGPYVVLPFFGPSTVRDGLAFYVDGKADLVYVLFDDVPLSNYLWTTRTVSHRAYMIDDSSALEHADRHIYNF